MAGNVSLEDKERVLALNKLMATSRPDRWGHQMKADTQLVSIDLKPQVQGTRKEVVLISELVVHPCELVAHHPVLSVGNGH